jgi:glycosyltransferase involved in cell wall biosynthesis
LGNDNKKVGMIKMKIAWFTPFSEKSAIGKYSKLATDAISKFASVDIFVSDKENLLKTTLKTVHYSVDERLFSMLREYDIIAYNMGDNPVFHEWIYDVLKNKKGIIIVHDASLMGFFYGYYHNCKNNGDAFNMLYEKLYNESASNATGRYLSNDGIKYGFMEEITKFCSGIIVHSDFHASIVRKVYNGPLSRVYFPFSQEYLSDTSTDSKRIKDTSKINILTVGNINRNKRVLEVVETIGRTDLLKKALCYNIIGSKADKDYLDQIESAIHKYDISDVINIIGYVDDDTLTAYYMDADVLCNLRNPALEGASWSLVEQMSLGKPVIVSDNGFYSEIPDDCVFKISTEQEEEELKTALSLMLDDRDLLKQKGRNAKKFVELQFSQEQYAKAFMLFTEQIIYGKPLDTLTNKLSFAMNQFGITKEMKIVDTVSEQMELLFNKRETT